MVVIFFLLVSLDGKPSFYPSGKPVNNYLHCQLCIDFIIYYLIFYSFICYLDKEESQKDNVYVVSNFSYKKTETLRGSCFIYSTIEEFGRRIYEL